jgi:hypothetical protein
LRCLQEAVSVCEKEGYDEDDIIIDVTGGFKTASIAGAMVTLNRHVCFQYVGTVPPFNCWVYNISYAPPARAE